MILVLGVPGVVTISVVIFQGWTCSGNVPPGEMIKECVVSVWTLIDEVASAPALVASLDLTKQAVPGAHAVHTVQLIRVRRSTRQMGRRREQAHCVICGGEEGVCP